MKKLTRYATIAATVFSLTACSSLQDIAGDAIKKPSVNYKTVKLDEFSLDQLKLTPVFNVDNKNSFPLPLKKIHYQFFVNGKNLITGDVDRAESLAANSTSQVPLPITLDKNTLSAFKSLLTNNKQLNYKVMGHLNLLGFQLPFEKESTFSRPEFKLGKLDVKKASFNQLDMSLDLIIDNPNDFKLPLGDISYSVASGGKSLLGGKVNNPDIGKGANTISIPLSIQPSKLFSNMFSLLRNPELPLDIKIKTPFKDIDLSKKLNLQSLLSK